MHQDTKIWLPSDRKLKNAETEKYAVKGFHHAALTLLSKSNPNISRNIISGNDTERKREKIISEQEKKNQSNHSL